MARSSDHQVVLKRGCYKNVQDRISSLPDEVLIYILSLIPTVLSVRTSVLSSRWKNLWASVPTLVFYNGCMKPIEPKVVNFIDKVIFSHNLPSIQRFCIRVRANEVTHLNDWIEAIVKRGVQKFVLSTLRDSYASDLLSCDLFTCKTLVELDLELCGLELDTPDTVYLPCLKVFRITLRKPRNELTTRLFSSCPVLEQLYIRAILNHKKRVFDISSPMLKTLEVAVSFLTSKDVEHVVMIDAPGLEDLTLCMNGMTRYILKTSSPELRAKLSGRVKSRQVPEDILSEILKQIFFVKHLSLSKEAVAALKIFPLDYWPVFLNLTNLEIDVFFNTDCTILSTMLHSMPNLATLKLLFSSRHERDKKSSRRRIYWIKPQSVPTCLQSCLVKVIVKGIKGWAGELKLIKYFLENANILTRVILLHDYMGDVTIDKFLEKLDQISRRSKTCKVKWGRRIGNLVQTRFI